MSTSTQRPSIQRKHTRSTDAKAEAELDSGLRISLDGDVFEVRLGDINSALTRELRQKSGMGFNQLMHLAASDPDTDIIAAFVWVARRLRGEDVEFDDVVVTYSQLLDDFDIDMPGKREDADSPEA